MFRKILRSRSLMVIGSGLVILVLVGVWLAPKLNRTRSQVSTYYYRSPATYAFTTEAPAASRSLLSVVAGSTSGGDEAAEDVTVNASYANAVKPNPVAAATATDRLVVKNTELVLVVKDPQAAIESLAQLAESLGGFVVSSNVYQTAVDAQGNKIMSGAISVRVPVEQLAAVLAQMKGLAVTVRSESTNGQDVTAQYVDLESQLRNLEQAETDLLAIMEAAQSSTGNDTTTRTQDVVTVYEKIAYYRGEIERIKGQMQYYQESAALSLINVQLEQDVSTQPLATGGWQPTGIQKDIVEAWIGTLQTGATAGMWLGEFLLPLAALVSLPLGLIMFGVRRLTRRNKPTGPAQG